MLVPLCFAGDALDEWNHPVSQCFQASAGAGITSPHSRNSTSAAAAMPTRQGAQPLRASRRSCWTRRRALAHRLRSTLSPLAPPMAPSCCARAHRRRALCAAARVMARSPRSCPAPTTASSWLRRHGDDSPRVAPRGLPTSTAAAAAAAPLVRDCARARVCEREARTRPVQRVRTRALRRGAHMLILKCETGCSTRSSPRRSRARHSLRPRRTRRPTRQAHAAAMLVRGCARSRCGARPHVISTQSPAV